MSGPGPAKLGRLAKAVEGAALEGSASTEITLLAYDSRQVRPGALFFALRGANADGSAYLEEASRRGAVAAVCEKGVRAPKGLAAVRVENARRAMADVAAEYYGHPTRRLKVVGVTGTNGKTTTTHMVRDVLRAAGKPTALVGTIRYEYGGRLLAATRTTPESADLQRIFAECLEAGEAAAAIEASSQGLAAERLRGVRFAAAAFTNLTPDHLDSHGTMEAYFAAKRRLFDALAEGAPAATNLDDEYGRRLAAEPGLAGRVVGYGLGPEAAVRAVGAKITETGSEFLAETPWGTARVRTPLAGRFNVYNALAALATCGAMGVAPETAAEARKYLAEKIRSGKFIVDSLHQRRETIRRIAEEIAAAQGEFFEQGISRLRPMTMGAVAEKLGVHETTVGRAVSGKYARTPQGVLELKFFFTTGIKTADGGSISAEAVKEAVGKIIAHEDVRRPLSDQAIAEKLNGQGFQLARRTVAKYREQLGLPPAHKRK